MNEKPVVALVIAAILCPICMLSILAPAVLGSAVAGVFAWFDGFDPVAATGLAVMGAVLAYGFFRRRRDRQGVADGGGQGGREDGLSLSILGKERRAADEREPTTPIKRSH